MLRLYSNSQTPRVVLLWLESASRSGEFLLRMATGAHKNELAGGHVFGPFGLADAEQALAERVAQYRAQGYQDNTQHDYLAQLTVADRKQRARAAIQLGWRKADGALAALLAAAAQATSEISSITDALGRLGIANEQVIALLREQAQKKLLSRRRSGVEALRALGDQQGLKLAFDEGVSRLPEALRAFVVDADLHLLSNVEPLTAILSKLGANELGLSLDQLYEFDVPVAHAAVQALLANNFERVHRWRYSKSILKRALLRGDADTFALIARAIELKGPSGARAQVKSGLDGQARMLPIYSRKTRAWLLRSLIRHLDRLGNFAPARYLQFAHAVLARTRYDDAHLPRMGLFGSAVLMHRVLYPQPLLKAKGLRRSGGRVLPQLSPITLETLPLAHVWRAHPNALLALLPACELTPVRQMLETAIQRDSSLLNAADAALLSELLEFPSIRALVGAEITRRFNPAQPDMALCVALLRGSAAARAVALGLLAQSQQVWVLDENSVSQLLGIAEPQSQASAAQAVIQALAGVSSQLRSQQLQAQLPALVDGEIDAHAARIEVLEHFAQELAPMLASTHIAAMLEIPKPAVQSVAAALLVWRCDAIGEIGLARVIALGESSWPAVRKHAIAIVVRNLPILLADSAASVGLLRLADSRFPDTRVAVFEVLRQLDFSAFGFEAIVSLCDSNQLPVQQFARDWVRSHLPSVDATALLMRLVEHPHRTMQDFALELLEYHLPPGAPWLQTVHPFLRACLRRARMSRSGKDRVIRVLAKRGLLDAQQAEIAVAVFNDSLRSATVADREPLLAALTQTQLAYPNLASSWRIQTTNVARTTLEAGV
jgi:hypothetical protein